jgi:protein involved in polysaccharide export with SLBB domain
MMHLGVTMRAAWLLLVVLFSIVQGAALSQTIPSKDGLSMPDLQSLKQGVTSQKSGFDTWDAVPVDAPLDANEYIVGPGDRFSLNIWSSAPAEHQLNVTPEGMLIMPGVGVLDVRGLTLAQARMMIAGRVTKRTVNAEVTLTLLVPRRITVTILGKVPHEGRKTVHASQRVDDIIEQATEFPTGRMDAVQYQDQLNVFRTTRSERRIRLQRRTGAIVPVDLVRYRTSGLGRFNPYLQEGDVVFVPGRSEADNSIAVFGGTIRYANYEFVEGDSLSTLIGMAMGFPADADPRNALFTRLSAGGLLMDTIRVDALAIAEHRIGDIALRGGDRLVVPKAAMALANYHVAVEGEVRFPGGYPITREHTKLSEVIRLAGGFTSNANLAGAVVYRRSTEQYSGEFEREQMLSLRASLPVQDTSYYRIESALRLTEEVVSVNFRGLFVDRDTTLDVVLKSNDRIMIPSRQHSIYVFGQVVSPGHVMFERGQAHGYYIQRAGGYANEARESDVKVIKAGTKIWLDPDETEIEDGDMVWIPKETTYPFSHYVTIYAQIAGIIGTVATVALLVKSLK